jgi:uncharacterized membrane protein
MGVLAYYLLSPRFEKPPVDKTALLNFLQRDESSVIRVLLESKGETSQAEIVRRTELPKVKVFRILRSLENKGVVRKEQQKKTNLVRLSEGVKKLLI